LAAVIVTLLMLAAGPTWRRRSSVTGAQIALTVAALVAVGAVGLLAGGPSTTIDQTFGGQGNEESARERVLLFEESVQLANERPLFGSGVGVKVGIQAVNSGRDFDTTAHNLLLDVWLRIGLIGAAFIVIALGVTAWTAVSVWRGRARNATAAAAIVGLVGVTGWLAKALVEPALDKFRLSLLVGLALGFVAAAWRSEQESQSDGSDLRRDTEFEHPVEREAPTT
jgi:O-antigen ligase